MNALFEYRLVFASASAVNATTWELTKKVALPEINMNNAHNMWTDKNQHLIYTTQISIFDRNTGKLVKNIEVGNDPSHVMTSTKIDELMVVLHGEQGVTVLGPKGESIESYTHAVSWTRPRLIHTDIG